MHTDWKNVKWLSQFPYLLECLWIPSDHNVSYSLFLQPSLFTFFLIFIRASSHLLSFIIISHRLLISLESIVTVSMVWWTYYSLFKDSLLCWDWHFKSWLVHLFIGLWPQYIDLSCEDALVLYPSSTENSTHASELV